MIAAVFEHELSAWEENIVAAIYLSQEKILPDCLPDDARQKVLIVLESLRKLPSAWAREMALQTLLVNFFAQNRSQG